jgi:hypothetical protein
MIRIAKPTDPHRIADLKQKIHNDRYMQSAMSGIAGVLTRGLLHWNGVELENEPSKTKNSRA